MSFEGAIEEFADGGVAYEAGGTQFPEPPRESIFKTIAGEVRSSLDSLKLGRLR
jgi:hypothetical protein